VDTIYRLQLRGHNVHRRAFVRLLAGSAIAGPCVVLAQQPSRIYRLSSLSTAGPLNEANPNGKILLAALAQRGYALGRNLSYDARGAMGDAAKVREHMAEFKAANVDVVVAVGYPVAVAAKALQIPTVIAWGAGDPVATGLIDGLARPGGSITGVSDVATTLTTKRLSLLKELGPTIRRVAMLWNKDDLGMTLRYEASAKVAQAVGIMVQPLGVREPNDFDEAFGAMNREPPDAILMVNDALTALNRKRIFDFAMERRLPAMYEYSFLVRDGGLMSYGPDLKETVERAAAMVDRIFQGVRPAELPFEEPTHYRFALNLKTAKAIGLTIPQFVLALADEVIE